MTVTGKRHNKVTPNCTPSKRRKELEQKYEVKFRTPGTVLTLGVGDTGQLGLGPDILDRTKPARFSAESLSTAGLNDITAEEFVQVVAGGMHTACLTNDGRVFTFGCNDEGALGRKTADSPSDHESIQDGDQLDKVQSTLQGYAAVEESRPGLVEFPSTTHIVLISAGDSHTAALDLEGRVWLWGTFRGASGVLGLTTPGEVHRAPMLLNINSLPPNTRILKIASGQDHLVCLTDDGRLYTMGCGEQGQLGRVAERFAKDGGRNGLELLLQPAECRVRGLVRFIDVWAGGFATVARSISNGAIYTCGLNNYGQLALSQPLQTTPHTNPISTQLLTTETVEIGLDSSNESNLSRKQGPLVQFMLTRACGFDMIDSWSQFAIGMHHTLALSADGEVYAVGRSDYGRLGYPLPPDADNSAVNRPLRVLGCLENRKCCWIGCGEACSFAIDEDGTAYAWGMGSSQQLAQENEDEDVELPAVMLGKNLLSRRAIMIDAGGQHTVILANDPSSSSSAFEHSSISNEKITSYQSELMDFTTSNSSSAKLSSINHNIETNDYNNQDHIVDCQPDNTEMSNIPLRSEVDVVQISKSFLESHEGMELTQNAKKNISADESYLTSVDLGTKHTMLSPSMTDCHSVGSTLASTAGATVNSSSLRSCSIASSLPLSDTASSCSNASVDSTQLSQPSSAHSTDGGGSSRLSSLGGISVQSSLFAQPQDETLGLDNRMDENRRRGLIRFPMQTSRSSFGGGMSICSTNSELGLPTDTTSLGSMTASPMDLISGEMGTGSFPLI